MVSHHTYKKLAWRVFGFGIGFSVLGSILAIWFENILMNHLNLGTFGLVLLGWGGAFVAVAFSFLIKADE